MNKIRRTQKRSLGFESLEGRLTLSTTTPFNFHGHAFTSGSTESIPDLAGTIGNKRFTGSGSATTAGTLVEGGNAHLTSPQGSLDLQFGSGTFTQVGRRQRQQVPVTIVKATGAYASFTGATGMGTTWNVPASSKQLSTFSGFINTPY